METETDRDPVLETSIGETEKKVLAETPEVLLPHKAEGTADPLSERHLEIIRTHFEVQNTKEAAEGTIRTIEDQNGGIAPEELNVGLAEAKLNKSVESENYKPDSAEEKKVEYVREDSNTSVSTTKITAIDPESSEDDLCKTTSIKEDLSHIILPNSDQKKTDIPSISDCTDFEEVKSGADMKDEVTNDKTIVRDATETITLKSYNPSDQNAKAKEKGENPNSNLSSSLTMTPTDEACLPKVNSDDIYSESVKPSDALENEHIKDAETSIDGNENVDITTQTFSPYEQNKKEEMGSGKNELLDSHPIDDAGPNKDYKIEDSGNSKFESESQIETTQSYHEEPLPVSADMINTFISCRNDEMTTDIEKQRSNTDTPEVLKKGGDEETVDADCTTEKQILEGKSNTAVDPNMEEHRAFLYDDTAKDVQSIPQLVDGTQQEQVFKADQVPIKEPQDDCDAVEANRVLGSSYFASDMDLTTTSQMETDKLETLSELLFTEKLQTDAENNTDGKLHQPADASPTDLQNFVVESDVIKKSADEEYIHFGSTNAIHNAGETDELNGQEDKEDTSKGEVSEVKEGQSDGRQNETPGSINQKQNQEEKANSDYTIKKDEEIETEIFDEENTLRNNSAEMTVEEPKLHQKIEMQDANDLQVGDEHAERGLQIVREGSEQTNNSREISSDVANEEWFHEDIKERKEASEEVIQISEPDECCKEVPSITDSDINKQSPNLEISAIQESIKSMDDQNKECRGEHQTNKTQCENEKAMDDILTDETSQVSIKQNEETTIIDQQFQSIQETNYEPQNKSASEDHICEPYLSLTAKEDRSSEKIAGEIEKTDNSVKASEVIKEEGSFEDFHHRDLPAQEVKYLVSLQKVEATNTDESTKKEKVQVAENFNREQKASSITEAPVEADSEELLDATDKISEGSEETISNISNKADGYSDKADAASRTLAKEETSLLNEKSFEGLGSDLGNTTSSQGGEVGSAKLEEITSSGCQLEPSEQELAGGEVGSAKLEEITSSGCQLEPSEQQLADRESKMVETPYLNETEVPVGESKSASENELKDCSIKNPLISTEKMNDEEENTDKTEQTSIEDTSAVIRENPEEVTEVVEKIEEPYATLHSEEQEKETPNPIEEILDGSEITFDASSVNSLEEAHLHREEANIPGLKPVHNKDMKDESTVQAKEEEHEVEETTEVEPQQSLGDIHTSESQSVENYKTMETGAGKEFTDDRPLESSKKDVDDVAISNSTDKEILLVMLGEECKEALSVKSEKSGEEVESETKAHYPKVPYKIEPSENNEEFLEAAKTETGAGTNLKEETNNAEETAENYISSEKDQAKDAISESETKLLGAESQHRVSEAEDQNNCDPANELQTLSSEESSTIICHNDEQLDLAIPPETITDVIELKKVTPATKELEIPGEPLPSESKELRITGAVKDVHMMQKDPREATVQAEIQELKTENDTNPSLEAFIVEPEGKTGSNLFEEQESTSVKPVKNTEMDLMQGTTNMNLLLAEDGETLDQPAEVHVDPVEHLSMGIEQEEDPSDPSGNIKTKVEMKDDSSCQVLDNRIEFPRDLEERTAPVSSSGDKDIPLIEPISTTGTIETGIEQSEHLNASEALAGEEKAEYEEIVTAADNNALESLTDHEKPDVTPVEKPCEGLSCLNRDGEDDPAAKSPLGTFEGINSTKKEEQHSVVGMQTIGESGWRKEEGSNTSEEAEEKHEDQTIDAITEIGTELHKVDSQHIIGEAEDKKDYDLANELQTISSEESSTVLCHNDEQLDLAVPPETITDVIELKKTSPATELEVPEEPFPSESKELRIAGAVKDVHMMQKDPIEVTFTAEIQELKTENDSNTLQESSIVEPKGKTGINVFQEQESASVKPFKKLEINLNQETTDMNLLVAEDGENLDRPAEVHVDHVEHSSMGIEQKEDPFDPSGNIKTTVEMKDNSSCQVLDNETAVTTDLEEKTELVSCSGDKYIPPLEPVSAIGTVESGMEQSEHVNASKALAEVEKAEYEEIATAADINRKESLTDHVKPDAIPVKIACEGLSQENRDIEDDPAAESPPGTFEENNSTKKEEQHSVVGTQTIGDSGWTKDEGSSTTEDAQEKHEDQTTNAIRGSETELHEVDNQNRKSEAEDQKNYDPANELQNLSSEESSTIICHNHEQLDRAPPETITDVIELKKASPATKEVEIPEEPLPSESKELSIADAVKDVHMTQKDPIEVTFQAEIQELKTENDSNTLQEASIVGPEEKTGSKVFEEQESTSVKPFKISEINLIQETTDMNLLVVDDGETLDRTAEVHVDYVEHSSVGIEQKEDPFDPSGNRKTTVEMKDDSSCQVLNNELAVPTDQEERTEPVSSSGDKDIPLLEPVSATGIVESGKEQSDHLNTSKGLAEVEKAESEEIATAADNNLPESLMDHEKPDAEPVKIACEGLSRKEKDGEDDPAAESPLGTYEEKNKKKEEQHLIVGMQTIGDSDWARDEGSSTTEEAQGKHEDQAADAIRGRETELHGADAIRGSETELHGADSLHRITEAEDQNIASAAEALTEVDKAEFEEVAIAANNNTLETSTDNEKPDVKPVETVCEGLIVKNRDGEDEPATESPPGTFEENNSMKEDEQHSAVGMLPIGDSGWTKDMGSIKSEEAQEKHEDQATDAIRGSETELHQADSHHRITEVDDQKIAIASEALEEVKKAEYEEIVIAADNNKIESLTDHEKPHEQETTLHETALAIGTVESGKEESENVNAYEALDEAGRAESVDIAADDKTLESLMDHEKPGVVPVETEGKENETSRGLSPKNSNFECRPAEETQLGDFEENNRTKEEDEDSGIVMRTTGDGVWVNNEGNNKSNGAQGSHEDHAIDIIKGSETKLHGADTQHRITEAEDKKIHDFANDLETLNTSERSSTDICHHEDPLDLAKIPETLTDVTELKNASPTTKEMDIPEEILVSESTEFRITGVVKEVPMLQKDPIVATVQAEIQELKTETDSDTLQEASKVEPEKTGSDEFMEMEQESASIKPVKSLESDLMQGTTNMNLFMSEDGETLDQPANIHVDHVTNASVGTETKEDSFDSSGNVKTIVEMKCNSSSTVSDDKIAVPRELEEKTDAVTSRGDKDIPLLEPVSAIGIFESGTEESEHLNASEALAKVGKPETWESEEAKRMTHDFSEMSGSSKSAESFKISKSDLFQGSAENIEEAGDVVSQVQGEDLDVKQLVLQEGGVNDIDKTQNMEDLDAARLSSSERLVELETDPKESVDPNNSTCNKYVPQMEGAAGSENFQAGREILRGTAEMLEEKGNFRLAEAAKTSECEEETPQIAEDLNDSSKPKTMKGELHTRNAERVDDKEVKTDEAEDKEEEGGPERENNPGSEGPIKVEEDLVNLRNNEVITAETKGQSSSVVTDDMIPVKGDLEKREENVIPTSISSEDKNLQTVSVTRTANLNSEEPELVNTSEAATEAIAEAERVVCGEGKRTVHDYKEIPDTNRSTVSSTGSPPKEITRKAEIESQVPDSHLAIPHIEDSSIDTIGKDGDSDTDITRDKEESDAAHPLASEADAVEAESNVNLEAKNAKNVPLEQKETDAENFHAEKENSRSAEQGPEETKGKEQKSISDATKEAMEKPLLVETSSNRISEKEKVQVAKASEPASKQEELQAGNPERIEDDEDAKTDEDNNEEEEGEDRNEDNTRSELPVMVEASRDVEVKVSPKKSHNILSGVGSKVKHSFAKVKKAIAGKHSQPKPPSAT